MPFTETITIINNSGKIISTGKHLVSIFKDARAAYQDKKDAIKAERAAAQRGLSRAQTFDAAAAHGLYSSRSPYHHHHYHHQQDLYERDDAALYGRRPQLEDGGYGSRRRSQDDGVRSLAASSSHRTSHRSRRSTRPARHRSSSRSRPALTESNLRTLSEISATAPSLAPRAYRAPYAETAPRDLALSRPSLLPPPAAATTPCATPTVAAESTAAAPVSTPRQSMLVHRHRSESSLLPRRRQSVDVHLAYGSIPPDLASRTDLDDIPPTAPDDADLSPPFFDAAVATQAAGAPPRAEEEQEARTLMQRVEAFLDEAQCLHHTASAIIEHLQTRPEAAAAVALTLAELSSLLARLGPGFLAVVKGGSPAVFALLASPQFLIGAGVAVGVTVVMFGGWKIVKRIRAAKTDAAVAAAAAAAGAGAGAGPMAFEMHPTAAAGGGGIPLAEDGVFDEALVLEEELSTIESWRRGIVPFGEDGTADLELISPEAERAMREREAEERRRHRKKKKKDEKDKSRGGKKERAVPDEYSYDDDDGITPDDSVSRVGVSDRTHGSRRPRRPKDADASEMIPERTSSKAFHRRDDDDGRSSQGSSSSRRSSHHSSSRSSKKASTRVSLKAIEDGGREGDDEVLRKEKKPNMLKTLFKKKKDKEDREKTESVLV